jgi:hypothetical protein
MIKGLVLLSGVSKKNWNINCVLGWCLFYVSSTTVLINVNKYPYVNGRIQIQPSIPMQSPLLSSHLY